MKRIIACAFCLLLFASACYGQTVTNYYVDTDESSGTQNGAAWETAWDCLEDAIAGISTKDLVTNNQVCKINLRGTAPDTNDVTVNGFTTSATQYVWIIVDAEDRHEGTYDANKYNMTFTDEYCLEILDDHVRVDGIQFGLTVTANNSGHCVRRIAQVVAGNNIQISNCIMNAVSVTGTGTAIGINSADTDLDLDVWNCVIYGFISANTPADTSFHGIKIAGVTDIWNCTIYGCHYGIGEYGTDTVNVTNCIVFENTDDFLATITMTYCLSDDDHTGDSATNQVITQTGGSPAYAALVTNAAGGDFSLTDSSSEAVGFGTDDPGDPIQDHTDIIGETRTSTWDCGAFEDVASSVVPVIVNIQNQ